MIHFNFDLTKARESSIVELRNTPCNSPNFDYLFIRYYIALNKIDALNDRMSQEKGRYKCEACGTEFNLPEEHKSKK